MSIGIKKIIKIIVIIFFFIVFIILGFCKNKSINEKESGKIRTIAIVTKEQSGEYWMSIMSGIEKAADDFNIEVITISPDSEKNEELQVRMIVDLINGGVDAIAISPINSYESNIYYDLAMSKNVPIFTFDTKILDNDIPYVGIDNKKVGYEMAKILAKKLNFKGKIGVVSGTLNQSAHKERVDGFYEYIESHSEMEIVFLEEGYSNEQLPVKKVKELIEQYKHIDGVFVTSAVTALGLVEMWKDDNCLFVTVDAQEDVLKAVQDGRIFALAKQPGYEIGYGTIEYIINGENNYKEDKILEWTVITR